MSGQTKAPDTNFSIFDQEMADKRPAVFDELRGRCPVAHSDQIEDDGFWVVTSYTETKSAAHDTSTFSSRYATLPRDMFGEGHDHRPPLTLDPPIHQQFRRALQPNFGPKVMQEWIPQIHEIARAAIANLIDKGSCDARSEYAQRISTGMMLALFGVPDEIAPEFEHWLGEIVESGDMARAEIASGALYGYLGEAVTQRRSESDPPDDMITKLMNSEFDGATLPDDELVGTLVMIMLAALETVASTLSSILVHLATNHADRDRLIAEPELVPTAVEEFVRYYSAVVSAREANHDAALGGVDIPADSMVLLCWNAANRDPDAFPDADKVILDRTKNQHVGFGIGPHRCLGIHLARLELKVGVEEWLAAIPEFELESEVPGYQQGLVCGPKGAPVKFPKGGGVAGAAS
jgi:cytochrome P450